MNRRQLLYSSLGLSTLFAAPASAAKEFWNAKPAAEWTDAEKQQVLGKSPWAREVVAQFNQGNMNRPDGDPGGPRGGLSMPGGGNPVGGPPPGGMGGIGMPSPSNMPPIKVTVRWDSAKPVREALKSTANPLHYVISLTGFPMMNGGLQGRNGQPATLEETLAAMQTRFKESTWISMKGKSSITPKLIKADPNTEGAILFLFSRDERPIKLEDKEGQFFTAMGPLMVKARFPLKEMVYRGNLEI